MTGRSARVASEAIGLWILVATCYWFVLLSLLRQLLEDPNYTHSLFVPALAGLLAWRRRESFRAQSAQPAALGLAVLAFGIFSYLVGVAAGELFTERISLLLVVLGVMLVKHGGRRMKVMAYPFALLLFMVPLPYVLYYRLTFPLQLASSKLAAGALSLLGVPLVRTGNILRLEDYSLEVVTACSGLRSIMALAALAFFIGDWLGLGRTRRAALLFLSIPVAIGVNSLRLVVTAVISLSAGGKQADRFLHGVSGIAVFLAGFIALILSGLVMEWKARRSS